VISRIALKFGAAVENFSGGLKFQALHFAV